MKANDGKLLELEHVRLFRLSVCGVDETGNKLTADYCMNDVADWALLRISERDTLLNAARQTLLDNLHLCDGPQCTLKVLRDAVEAVEGKPLLDDKD